MNMKKIALGMLGLVFAAVLVWAESDFKITDQPQDQIVAEGSSVTFSVKAEGGSSVFMDMIWIKPGKFTMGSPTNEIGRWPDEVRYRIDISRGFWIGKYEVTQAQYMAVMGTNPAKEYGVGDDYPVYNVSWSDATNFCAKLTTLEKEAGRLPDGYAYCLPPEVLWEYACRAGTTTAFNNGENILDEHWDKPCPGLEPIGWYPNNSGETTHPVGQKQPNAWGLYDMHGNVWEWCQDWFPGYKDKLRVVRGGGWCHFARYCRSAARGSGTPHQRDRGSGFRVLLYQVADSPDKVLKEESFKVPLSTFTYQWKHAGNSIKGATGSSYTIEKVKPEDAGSYYVVVRCNGRSVVSKRAHLTLEPEKAKTEDPVEQ